MESNNKDNQVLKKGILIPARMTSAACRARQAGNNYNNSNNKKDLILGVAMFTSASILGPLVFFGTIGYILDKTFDSQPVYLLISIGLAFVTTNIFLFKKVKKMMKMFDTD